MQVVVEDYVHREWVKLSALILVRLACLLLAVAGVFAVLRVALKG
jgi:succinate dehydrogenase / fumarate reductase membrane anchor subunit